MKMASKTKFLELLKAKTSYIVFLVILYAAVSVFVQTFMKTPFLPGGRGSIEYLYVTGSAERFGYGRLYTVFTIIALSLNAFVGDMVLAVKASIITVFAIYFFSLYMLSSTISTKWYALAVVPTAFLPTVSDTVFKGDYMLFTAVTFMTLFILGVCRFIEKPSRTSLTVTAIALALIPFTDPQMITWLSIIVLATIFSSAILSDRRLIPHFVLYATIYVAMATLSITIFTGLNDRLWQPSPLTQLSSNMLVSAFLIVASAFGLLSLHRRGYRRLLYAIILWLSISILFSILEPRLFSFAVPVFSALVPTSLSYMGGMFAVRKSDDEYEVEVSLGRFAAASPAILLIILLILAIPSTIILGDHEIVPPPRVSDIIDASNFLSHNAGGGLVVAHPSLASWLLASSNLNVLPVVDDTTFKAADLLTTTSFRIMNSFLKVDDWEPFSAAKAPLIHVYDGKNFRKAVYIDDSYSRFLLADSEGREFIESPYRAKFLSYVWNESSEQIALTMSFQTPGLIIDKTITLSKTEPTVSIEYHATAARKDVSLKGLAINVYSLPMDILPELNIVGYEANMAVEGMKLTIQFEGNVSSISQDRTRDQRYVTCNFAADSMSAYGKVNVRALNPARSNERPWYSSFFGEAKKYGVDYVIIPQEHKVFMEGALPYKVDDLVIKDSFVRFIVNSWGEVFQEAPAYAEVLNETVQENSRLTLYKTAGLFIEKDVYTSDNCLNITYNVQPHKSKTHLIMSTFSIWIDWARGIVSKNISLKEKTVELALDSGRFQISFSGNLSDIAIEPHPEYGQMRVIATFQLQPSSGKIGAAIKSDKMFMVQYSPTTRPLMKDNDVITVSTEGGVFEPVKELKLYTIYKILSP